MRYDVLLMTELRVLQQTLFFSHLHKNWLTYISLPAFQASSPKTSKPGWFASRAFFLPQTAFTVHKCIARWTSIAARSLHQQGPVPS